MTLPMLDHPSVIRLDEPWALYLDFDGSLVDIAPDPFSIVLPHDLAPTLMAIRRRLSGAVALVTGRAIATIDTLLSPHKFDIAGTHGAEIRIGGVLTFDLAHNPPGWVEARRALFDLRRLDPGCIVETKGHAVAVHWRLAPHLEDVILEHVFQIAARLGPSHRVQRGKCVAEVLPVCAEKVNAIETLMQWPPYKNRRPIYIGDDLTDEPALEFVRAQGGLSIHVGAGPSAAEYRLGAPAAVRAWLRSLIAGAKSGSLEAQF